MRSARLDPAPLLLAGRNLPYGDGIAFLALAELAPRGGGCPARSRRRAGQDGSKRSARRRAEETAATLAATLDGGDADSDAPAIRRSWRQLIAGLADERPVLIAVDDFHWADEGSTSSRTSSACPHNPC